MVNHYLVHINHSQGRYSVYAYAETEGLASQKAHFMMTIFQPNVLEITGTEVIQLENNVPAEALNVEAEPASPESVEEWMNRLKVKQEAAALEAMRDDQDVKLQKSIDKEEENAG